jgi:hypothetical protein
MKFRFTPRCGRTVVGFMQERDRAAFKWEISSNILTWVDVTAPCAELKSRGNRMDPRQLSRSRSALLTLKEVVQPIFVISTMK